MAPELNYICVTRRFCILHYLRFATMSEWCSVRYAKLKKGIEIITVKCRYNAVNFTKIATSSIAIANGMHCSDMNSQHAPHVPP